MATLREKGNVYFIDCRINGRRFRKNEGVLKIYASNFPAREDAFIIRARG